MKAQELIDQLVAADREGRRIGRDEEREDIVRHLRDRLWPLIGTDIAKLFGRWIDEIERGEHRKEGE